MGVPAGEVNSRAAIEEVGANRGVVILPV